MRKSQQISEERAINIAVLVWGLKVNGSPEDLKEKVMARVGEKLFQEITDQIELGIKEYANYIEERDNGELEEDEL